MATSATPPVNWALLAALYTAGLKNMVYRHFRTLCIVRVAFLCATICALVFVLFQTSYYTTVLILAGIALYQAYALIHYVERTNRDLTRFLQAIRYEDFSQSFSGRGLGSAFDDLRKAFNDVLNAFRRTRAEKEENFQYLQTVVQHVGVGLVCYDPGGRIELMNTAGPAPASQTAYPQCAGT